MISARNALQSIENAIRETRRDEDRLNEALHSASEEAARLRVRHAESLRALAEVRIDAIKRGETAGQLDRAERTALRILDERGKRLEDIGKRRKEMRSKLEALETRHIELVGKVEALHGEVDTLESRVEVQLQSEAPWQDQDKKAQKAAEVATAADEKADAAEADLEQKGEPYRDDPLFMYLWDRGFGTSRYDGGTLSRYFDRKIARLIGYESARRDFNMLNEIPMRLRQHADDVFERAESEEDVLEAIERQALEHNGIIDLETALGSLQQEIAQAEAGIKEANDELKRLDEKQSALSDPEGDAEYQQVVAMMAEALDREELKTLWNEARQTPTPEDETIVRELTELEEATERGQRQIEEARRAALQIAKKRAELERSRDGFYRAGYDDPTGGFSNGDLIGEVIGGILTGAASTGKLDDILREGFRRASRSGRGGFGGGLRMPSPGPWRGQNRSRRSRPARRSSQRSKGGFRTGGSF